MVLWVQSSQAVRNRLEALNTYETMKQESNGLGLLVPIKNLLYNVQDCKYATLSIHLAKRQFYLNSQGRSTSVAGYYEQFNNIIDMLEHCGASLGGDDGIITKVLKHHDIEPATATATQKENAQIEAQEWYYGLAFQMGAFVCVLVAIWRTLRMISLKGSTDTPNRKWMHTMYWQIGSRTHETWSAYLAATTVYNLLTWQ